MTASPAKTPGWPETRSASDSENAHTQRDDSGSRITWVGTAPCGGCGEVPKGNGECGCAPCDWCGQDGELGGVRMDSGRVANVCKGCRDEQGLVADG